MSQQMMTVVSLQSAIINSWYKDDTKSVNGTGSPIDTIVEISGGSSNTTKIVKVDGTTDTTINVVI